MRRALQMLAIIFTMLTGLTAIPVFAADCPDGCVSTTILGEDGCACDDGKGSSVFDVLKVIVDILSVGIGILGVIGISVVGIQYLTAGGNEEQTKKAKRRMLEIIIGLAIYALFYAALRWLLPNFNESVQKISHILPAQISYPTSMLKA